MNEKFNKNAKVEKLTKKVGKGVRLIVIGPYSWTCTNGNNLMTCASMLKVVHGIPGESIFTCQV